MFFIAQLALIGTLKSKLHDSRVIFHQQRNKNAPVALGRDW
jgi:hypothetical protein